MEHPGGPREKREGHEPEDAPSQQDKQPKEEPEQHDKHTEEQLEQDGKNPEEQPQQEEEQTKEEPDEDKDLGEQPRGLSEKQKGKQPVEDPDEGDETDEDDEFGEPLSRQLSRPLPTKATPPTLQEKIRKFNALPRHSENEFGVGNRWVFGVWHCPLEAPTAGERVLAVNIDDPCQVTQSESGDIMSWMSVQDAAYALVPYLIDAFCNESNPVQAAPWSWCTVTPTLAEAVSMALAENGVRRELCEVGACSLPALRALDTKRDILFKDLCKRHRFTQFHYGSPQFVPARLGDRSRCHGCGLRWEVFFLVEIPCERCHSAWYYSEQCREDHRKQHRSQCFDRHQDPRNFDVHTYFNLFSLRNPDAKDLLMRLGVLNHIEFLRGDIRFTIRRLVVTGHDDDDNFRLLFGPNWKASTVRELQRWCRLEFLLRPEPGSPNYRLSQYLDSYKPRIHPLSIRPMTEEEEEMIKNCRIFQRTIIQTLGLGNGGAATPVDLQSVRMSMDVMEEDAEGIFWVAANAMDQGHPIDNEKRLFW